VIKKDVTCSNIISRKKQWLDESCDSWLQIDYVYLLRACITFESHEVCLLQGTDMMLYINYSRFPLLTSWNGDYCLKRIMALWIIPSFLSSYYAWHLYLLYIFSPDSSISFHDFISKAIIVSKVFLSFFFVGSLLIYLVYA